MFFLFFFWGGILWGEEVVFEILDINHIYYSIDNSIRFSFFPPQKNQRLHASQKEHQSAQRDHHLQTQSKHQDLLIQLRKAEDNKASEIDELTEKLHAEIQTLKEERIRDMRLLGDRNERLEGQVADLKKEVGEGKGRTGKLFFGFVNIQEE